MLNLQKPLQRTEYPTALQSEKEPDIFRENGAVVRFVSELVYFLLYGFQPPESIS